MIMECNVELSHAFPKKKKKKMVEGSSPELSNIPSGVNKLTSLDLNPTPELATCASSTHFV